MGILSNLRSTPERLKTGWGNYRKDKYLQQIASGFVYVIIGMVIGRLFFGTSPFDTEYYLGLVTGLIGIFVTVLILDRLSERRTRIEADISEKQMLIAQLGSPSSIITRQAIKILWARGWLTDGSVNDSNLWEADLENADLGECNLQSVKFKRANLRGARLWANLKGALLEDADLTDAKFVDPYHPERMATMDETTLLPDKSYYIPKLGLKQLDRFTNRGDPNYWRSKMPTSPAYRDPRWRYQGTRRRAQDGLSLKRFKGKTESFDVRNLRRL